MARASYTQVNLPNAGERFLTILSHKREAIFVSVRGMRDENTDGTTENHRSHLATYWRQLDRLRRDYQEFRREYGEKSGLNLGKTGKASLMKLMRKTSDAASAVMDDSEIEPFTSVKKSLANQFEHLDRQHPSRQWRKLIGGLRDRLAPAAPVNIDGFDTRFLNGRQKRVDKFQAVAHELDALVTEYEDTLDTSDFPNLEQAMLPYQIAVHALRLSRKLCSNNPEQDIHEFLADKRHDALLDKPQPPEEQGNTIRKFLNSRSLSHNAGDRPLAKTLECEARRLMLPAVIAETAEGRKPKNEDYRHTLCRALRRDVKDEHEGNFSHAEAALGNNALLLRLCNYRWAIAAETIAKDAAHFGESLAKGKKVKRKFADDVWQPKPPQGILRF